jgi:hypothetical protein
MRTKPYFYEPFYTIKEVADKLNKPDRTVRDKMKVMGIKGSFQVYGVIYLNENQFNLLINNLNFSDEDKYLILESKINKK